MAAALPEAVFPAQAHSTAGLTQMVTYVKRHPEWSRQDFWDYWQKQHAPKVVPLSTHFNITRYQQIQVGGKVLPTESGADAPASDRPVDFDGIAMFLYEKPEDLSAMLAHPYYLEIVAPDEAKFIDKEAFGSGMVATFVGASVESVDDGSDVWVGDEETRLGYRRLFESYEKA